MQLFSSLTNTSSLPATPRPPAAPREVAEFTRHLAPGTADPIRNIHLGKPHLHPPLGNHMDDVDDPKSTATQGTEDCHRSYRPEDKLQVEILADVRAIVGLADSHGENGVGDHPRDNHVGSHGSVVILLLLSFRHATLRHFESVTEITQCLIVARVDIELLARHFKLDGVVLARDSGSEIDVDDIVAFSTPGDVVGVAECVHLEGADIRWEKGEILG